MPKNYLTFTDLRAAYAPKDDTISITSGDPELAKDGFRLTLQRHTKAERTMRKRLEDAGLIRLPEGEFPNFVTYLGGKKERFEPWHIFPLGVDRQGGWVGLDFINAPHTFITGQTGSGKTVVLNTVMAHAAANLNRWEIKAVDLERINYSSLREAPVLGESISVATEMDQTVSMIDSLHELMMQRFAMMEATGRKDLWDLVEAGRVKAQLLLIEEAYVLLAHYDLSRAKPERQAAASLWNEQRDQVYSRLLDILRIGRAAGIMVVMGAQRFDYATFPPEMMNLFDNRILLGSSDQRKAVMVLDWVPQELKGLAKGRGYVNIAGEHDELQFFHAGRDDIKRAAFILDR